jgi:hypothetical protein
MKRAFDESSLPKMSVCNGNVFCSRILEFQNSR